LRLSGSAVLAVIGEKKVEETRFLRNPPFPTDLARCSGRFHSLFLAVFGQKQQNPYEVTNRSDLRACLLHHFCSSINGLKIEFYSRAQRICINPAPSDDAWPIWLYSSCGRLTSVIDPASVAMLSFGKPESGEAG
jgi:hypothetical protein